MNFLTPKLRQANTEGGFLLGKQITIADFVVGGLYTNMAGSPKIGFEPKRWRIFLDDHPELREYGSRFVHENKDYLATR